MNTSEDGNSHESGDGHEEAAEDDEQAQQARRAEQVQSVAVQLDMGTLIIRLLACGLYVVGTADHIAPGTQNTQSAITTRANGSHSVHTSTSNSNSLTLPPRNRQTSAQGRLSRSPVDSAASDVGTESVDGSVAGGAGVSPQERERRRGQRQVARVRKRVEEVAGWLDEELVGFVASDGF
jgi:hypothetical protein